MKERIGKLGAKACSAFAKARCSPFFVCATRSVRVGIRDLDDVIGDCSKKISSLYNVLKHIAIFNYDVLNRQTASFALPKIATYNDASEAVACTDELMHTTITVYDEIGRMLNTINHSNETSDVSEYDIAGRMPAQKDPFGERTVYVYDDANRQVSVTDQDSNTTTTVYDSKGRVQSTISPSGTTTYGYDFQSHQTMITDPQSDVTRYVYNRVGEVLEMIDAKQKSTFNEYDILGRMTKVTDRLEGLTRYGYDRVSRRGSITDAEDGVTRYGYDAFGRPATTTYPDHVPDSQPGDLGYGIVTLEHDHHDRMFRRTDQQGDTMTYRYDTRGRLVARDYRTRVNGPEGDITDSDTFGYDNADRMDRATSERYENTVVLGYDEVNRRTTESLEIGGQTYTITTGYDIASRVDQIDYPDGTIVNREYNTRYLLQTVKLDGDVIDTRMYDSSSRLQSCVYGNEVMTTFGYREDDRVSQIATTNAGAQKVGTYGYGYDANKNKTAETIMGAEVMNGFGFETGANGYDTEDRLVNWNRTDGNQDQAWDLSLVGDWDQFSEEGVPTTYAHNSVHELTMVGSQPVGYDPKGNPLGSSNGFVYAWDFDNKLVSADDAGFEYDALGRRVLESGGSNGSGNVLVCSGQQLLATYQSGTASSSPNRMFVYGVYIDEPILLLSGIQSQLANRTVQPDARNDSIAQSPTSQLERFYYSRNQQFSITALTDENGNVVERYRYDAYGNTQILSPTGDDRDQSSVGNVFMYTGRYYHPELELYYFRARYYDPAIGRFIGRDPLEYVDGMSMYRGYFALGGMDPSGTLWQHVKDNIYKATENDGSDTLRSLALQITGDSNDWVCIWPNCGEDKWRLYPIADENAEADVSNLIATRGDRFVAYPKSTDNFITNMVPSIGIRKRKFRNAKGLAAIVQKQSGQGNTPLQFLGILGHCGNGLTMSNGQGITWTVNDIFAGAEQTDNATNAYESAVKKKGPPRCWFCRDTGKTRFYGCNTTSFAKAFVGKFQRGRASWATGTNRFIWTDGEGLAWFSTTNGPDIQQGSKHRTLTGLENETNYWETHYAN